MDGVNDDEGWSFVVNRRFIVDSGSGIDTTVSDSVTCTDSSATVSITYSGMICCLVEVNV